MKGRKPTPTKLKILKGNPGRRPVNTAEPKMSAELPTCPKHLQGEARKEWRRSVKLLHESGILAAVDRAALAAYCSAWERWIEAEEAIKLQGMIQTSPNGYPILNPYLSISNKAMEQMRAFLTEFGMTPSSRSRIKVEKKEDEDPMDAFLNRGQAK